MQRKPEVGVGAVVIHDGRLLVVERGRPPAAGLWSLPGGRLQLGETLADGVLRELREETGLTGTVTGLVGLAERIADGWHYVILDYEVAVSDPKALLAGDDAADARWVDAAELSALPLVPRLMAFLDEHGVSARLR